MLVQVKVWIKTFDDGFSIANLIDKSLYFVALEEYV